MLLQSPQQQRPSLRLVLLLLAASCLTSFLLLPFLPHARGPVFAKSRTFPLGEESSSSAARWLCPSVFLVWTSPADTLRQLNFKCLESLFLHHPCAKVTILAYSLQNRHFERLRAAGLDLEIVPITDALFAGIPFGHKWLARQPELRNHPHYAAHFSDFIRYAILFQFGGTYLDFDHLLTRPLPRHLNAIGAEYCLADNPDCFLRESLPTLRTAGVGWAPYKRMCAAQGVMLHWQASHPILLQGLKHFDSGYDPECWGCAGPRFFGRMIPEFPERVTLLAPRMLYPVNFQDVAQTFETYDGALLNRIANESVGFHLYGRTVRHLSLRPRSTLERLMSSNQLFQDDLLRSADQYGQLLNPPKADFVQGFLRALYPPYDASRWALSRGCATRGDGIAASLLSYKRLKFFPAIVASIATHPAFERVVVMNNNPDVVLDPDEYERVALSSSTRAHMCIAVYNVPPRTESPLFLGRFLACLWSQSEGCYFQDDDWLVHSKDALVQAFLHDRSGIHTLTSGYMVQYTRAWRFFDPAIGLHAGFAWLGTGAIASRSTVSAFLVQLLQRTRSLQERCFADFFLTPFHNVEPNVVEGEIEELTREGAFSGQQGTRAFDTGVQRNFRWMQFSMETIYSALQAPRLPGRSVAATTVASAELGMYYAASTRAWARANGLSVLVGTNMVPFPREPTSVFALSVGMDSWTNLAPRKDAELGWDYSEYSQWSLGNLVGGDDGRLFLARRPCSSRDSSCLHSVFHGRLLFRLSEQRRSLVLRWCQDGLSVDVSTDSPRIVFRPNRRAGLKEAVDQECKLVSTTIDWHKPLWEVEWQIILESQVQQVRLLSIIHQASHQP
jgi:hypothetical protein